jgi:hypothetical protein
VKRQCLSWICGALLFWVAFDDVLAAKTPDVDDEIAAALDNDFLQDAPANVQVRGESERALEQSLPTSHASGLKGAMAGALAAPAASWRVASALVFLMLMQC